MLKRLSAIWVPLALVVVLLAYWAAHRGGAPGSQGEQAKSKPTPSAPTPSAPAVTSVPVPHSATTTASSPTTASPVTQPGYDTATDTMPPSAEAPWTKPGASGKGDGGSGTADGGLKSEIPNPKSETTGLETPSTTLEPARERASAFCVYDSFEEGNAWAVESAADHATLSVSDEYATDGQKALKAAWKAFGKGNFELRREVKLDLSEATSLKVDVYSDAGPMDLVLGVRAGQDASLFTTPPQPIDKGWNKDVTFRFSDLSFAEKGPWGTSWAWTRDSVNRISLIVREREVKEGTVYIDHLRFDQPATKVGAKAKPVIQTIAASAQTVDRYDTIELTVAFNATYQNFFDRAEIDLTASFFAPSGKRTEVKGFVYDTDAATGKPGWKVRFTPGETGLWRYDVTVKDAGGEATSQTYEFLCRQQGERAGFVRVSKADPQYFETDSGAFFYPVGQNVCWASNFEHFLDQIKTYGGNYVRVWLCPWNLQLEDPKEAGKVDLAVATAIDRLLEQCQARGIYLQLVLRYHGMQDASWDKNPYNAANGGPCTWAGDFFTDGKAKDLHKRFLEYAAARWGSSPALFAWELWNEADLARCDRESDLVAWHREMAAHLRKADSHGHLITTSVCSPGRATALFELPDIDFIPVHVYTRDLARQFQSAYLQYRKLRKPIFIGEFSGGFKPADDLGDTRGVHLHAGLWLTFMMPFAGNAMPWWWDTFVDKNKLYPHWAALVQFGKDVDRRGKGYETVCSQVPVGDDAVASLQGLVTPSEALLWVYDEARIVRPDQADRPLIFAERPVRLSGMLGGKFQVQIWDTWDGKVLTETTATSDDGTLSFVLPKSSRDLAVRISREKPGKAVPRVEW